MKTVWLQVNGSNKLDKEEQMIYDYLTTNFPNEYILRKVGRKQVRKLVLPEDFAFAAGNVDFVHCVFGKLDHHYNPSNSYPTCVRKYLNRDIKRRSLFELTDRMMPLFIKPATELKLFPGFICHIVDDYRLRNLSQHTMLDTCEVFDVGAEVRVFWHSDSKGNLSYYCESDDEDLEFINKEIIALLLEHESWHSGSFDMGIINGEWSLIEVNESYSIGAYGDITPELYTKIIEQRFKDIM